MRHLSDETSISPTEPLQYDPQAIADYYRHRLIVVWARWSEILRSLFSFLLHLGWNRVTGKTVQHQSRQAIHLRQVLTRLGPTFIKMGQALSTRPDLLPAVYLQELTKLQDQIPPFPDAIAYQFIEEELGASPHELFAEFSPYPIAAASLGQVYKGKLKTGESVAVKVQRPDLAARITIDVYLLRQVATWAQRRIRTLHHTNLVAVLDEFAARLFEEMDYTQEGRNAEKFVHLYGQVPDVYVPQIYWAYTRHRVLTMEWISGTKLTNAAALQTQGINARHMIEIGVQCTLRQLLGDGFFHADPHPGNLLAMPNGKLAYLDFGMMSEIKPHQRYGLINAVVHIINREFDGLTEDYITLEFLPADVDRAPLVSALTHVFDYAPSASVTELNFQKIVAQLSALMYEFPFQVPAYYALIMRSLVTLEGIAMGIAPDYKVLGAAAPYVARRLLNDPAPELRSSLSHLLFKENRFRWNRLANLIRDARSSSEYSAEATFNQVIDFLFSERGQVLRDRLANELVLILDGIGSRLLQNPIALFNLRQELNGDGSEIGIDPDTFHHMKRIWSYLQASPNSNPHRIVQQIMNVLMQILSKSEAYQFGQQVILGLIQKAFIRLIRA
jgi:predicted unusual protein kinase regulating ubiquinone biosynthesis (AarF/ABC1/UbiB family)